MAAIVSVVCARRPLSSSGRHPTAVGPLLRHLHHLLHLLRRCRKTATRRTPPPPAIPAGGVNYWKIVGRSEILFLASRRQHGRDPSSVLYSAVPSGARLIYASSATVRWRTLRSSSRNVLLKPSPALAPPVPARARGMNFVSHALHFISQTSHPCPHFSSFQRCIDFFVSTPSRCSSYSRSGTI